MQQADKESAALQAHAGTKSLMDAAGGSFIGIILGGFANVASAIGRALSDLAEALFGNYGGTHPALVIISDGMTALNNNVELLHDVPGYAGAIMLQNHRFGSGSSWKKVPFNGKYGPEKKARLNTSNNRMYIDKGSWSCHMTISTGSGGGVGHALRVQVFDQNNSLKITRYYDWQSPNAGWDMHYALPVIATADDWSIEVSYRHSGTWWYVLGGTEKTLLWVERKNMDTANSAIVTPTDGDDIT